MARDGTKVESTVGMKKENGIELIFNFTESKFELNNYLERKIFKEVKNYNEDK